MRIKTLFKLLLILITGTGPGITGHAQGPPVFTETPVMLGLQGRGIRTFGKFISKENARIYIHPVAVPYNLTAKWQIGGVVPFVNKSLNNAGSRSGIGDIKVFTKYQLIQKDRERKTFRTLIKVVESFPTGNSEGMPPLGSGVYQTTIGLVNGYVATEFGIYGEVAYHTSFGKLPDRFLYNLAFGYPLLPQKYPPKQINVYLELNGNVIADGNNHNLFLSPAVQYIAGRRLLFETGVQLPLAEEVPEMQKTNFIYTLGTRVLIF